MTVSNFAPRPQLWILRHGETEWSKSGQYTGLTDLPLTVEGEQQAVEARKVLDQVDFDLVLTSPLRRARRCNPNRTAATAQIPTCSQNVITMMISVARLMRGGSTSRCVDR